MNTTKELIAKIEKHDDLNVLVGYIDETMTFDDAVEVLQDAIYEQEIIYFTRAIEYLANHDASLQRSANYLHEQGHEVTAINSELMATLVYQENLRDALAEVLNAIETDIMLKCFACDILISKEELDENAAYTYPDNEPYCPAHDPNLNA